ncbi:MAG: hypothetical protein QM775_17845 [Pirellulales bacterium]
MNFSNDDNSPSPDETPQRDYREAIMEIVSGINFDNGNVLCGLGLLTYITGGSFVGAGINVITHPDAGSLSSNAELVAEVFAPIHQSKYWWDDQLRACDPQQLKQWRDWWRDQFRNSPLVTKVDF